MKKPIEYRIYGSGDEASKELLEMFNSAGVPCQFMNIQEAMGSKNLKFLLDHKLYTVPQVFDANNDHIGDFAAGVALLESFKSKALVVA